MSTITPVECSYESLETQIKDLMEGIEKDPFLDTRLCSYTSLYQTEVWLILSNGVRTRNDSIVKNAFFWELPRLDYFITCLFWLAMGNNATTYAILQLHYRDAAIFSKAKSTTIIKDSIEELKNKIINDKRLTDANQKGQLSCVIKVKTLSSGFFSSIKTYETDEIPLKV